MVILSKLCFPMNKPQSGGGGGGVRNYILISLVEHNLNWPVLVGEYVFDAIATFGRLDILNNELD